MDQDYNPDSLVDICTDFCIRQLETFCEVDVDESIYVLKANVSLPNEICERMLRRRKDSLDDGFLQIFRDLHHTPIKRLNIRNCSQVTDEGLATILRHSLYELDLTNCNSLTEETLFNINLHGSELLSLTIGNSVHLLPESLVPDITDVILLERNNAGEKINTCGYPYREKGHIINAPNLRRLVIKNYEEPIEPEYLELLFRPLPLLTHLDISGCAYLGDLSCLVHLQYLVSLVLYGVPQVQSAISNICMLKSLRHLDISQHGEKFGIFHKPAKVLERIVQSLSNLTSLDISGTNLARSGKFTESFNDIPALRCRTTRPFEFLGLLNTTEDACQRQNIPALKITGDANEEQILTAAKVYLERPELLGKVLNDLFRIFRYENCRNPPLALKLILQAMQQNINDKYIQISGSASLFYIVKEQVNLNFKMKRLIIQTLLDGMSEHKTVSTLMRNGCLTLITFRIPQDVMFEYQRLVDIVLYVVSIEDQDEFVQRIGVYLLNGLACQVDNAQKRLVGEMGIVHIMLKLINWKIGRQNCDEIMELAWSTMWNITDETPINCKRFLEGEGMDYFLRCLKIFPDKPELLRNMMGLMGNVAEVPELRIFLVESEYLTVFSDLLDSSSDGIEVSYNAAGVLAHIVSDGAGAWLVKDPSRQKVLSRMEFAINKWDLSTKRNINYRSFEPIFRLLHVHHTPEAQHWAVWALANLTQVYPEKYCSLMKEEGGIELLMELQKHDFPYQRINELTQKVIANCCEFRD